MPLHIAFVDLTKAFDYVNRDARFTVLKNVGRPPILLELMQFFHKNMQCICHVDRMNSDPFSIVNGVKQVYVLASILIWI